MAWFLVLCRHMSIATKRRPNVTARPGISDTLSRPRDCNCASVSHARNRDGSLLSEAQNVPAIQDAPNVVGHTVQSTAGTASGTRFAVLIMGRLIDRHPA